MKEIIFYAAAGWMTVLLGATIVLIIRSRSAAGRILAVDMLVLVLVGLLALYSAAQGVAYFLDAAIALALISFVATIAAARYNSNRDPF